MWVEGRGDLPGQLVVVSGPSGSGKSSLLRSVLSYPSLNTRLSVSATTRPPRPGEVPGLDYHFMTREAFLESKKQGGFLESAEYNDRLYGTPAKPVYEALGQGHSVLLEIEVQGALQVRRQAPSALFVFIKAPSFRELENRLKWRGTETDATLINRLRRAREELAEAHWYDVQLVNDNLGRCAEELIAILKTFRDAGDPLDA